MISGRQWVSSFLVLVLALGTGSGAMSAGAAAPVPADSTPGAAPADAAPGATSWPPWLEPRGINVAELVGQVPEAYLHGMILSYYIGIVVYESGVRNGNTAVVTTTIYPRLVRGQWGPYNRASVFGCAGQRPALDHMGSIFPASTMRLYASDGTEITSQVATVKLDLMDTQLPLYGSREGERYPTTPPEPPAHQPVPLASNSGCTIVIYRDYYPLKGVFTFTLDPALHVSVIAQQPATFHSYIGVGDMGIFQPLMNQMRGRFGDRHERIPLAIPAGANYFVLRFPPMPGDYYTDVGRGTLDNAARLTSGTFRLADGGALSADLTTSSAWPLRVAWQDQDQAPGRTYLPRIANPDELAVPEYLIPAGMPYNPCFTQGNCPTQVLDQIYNTPMRLEVFYLSVSASGTNGQWLPLKMAGPAWVPGLVGTPEEPVPVSGVGDGSEATTALMPAGPSRVYKVYLPFITRSSSSLPPPPPGCLCGWFDTTGRMLTYVASSR